jgi:hypothetical protein
MRKRIAKPNLGQGGRVARSLRFAPAIPSLGGHFAGQFSRAARGRMPLMSEVFVRGVKAAGHIPALRSFDHVRDQL